jgi:hypothetical protein
LTGAPFDLDRTQLSQTGPYLTTNRTVYTTSDMAEAQEALAFVQRVPAKGGGSLYEHLVKLVVKVRSRRSGRLG